MSLNENEIRRYLETPELLKKAIEGLTEEQLKWKQAPDKWSVTEVLSHLADHNLIVSFRIREIVSGSTVQLPGFKQDPWVEHSFANAGAATDILELYGALIRYNAQLFARLPEEYGEKTAVNQKGDKVTLNDVIRSFIEHVHVHLGQIDRIKRNDPTSSNSSCAV
ncbi:hypothetical protein J19TS2_41540 [Cohnella xylanilytica]|uniref:DinB family protein n=1 Tax=Cohnella xylanilytica TaxID=557555 RepID=UPI001B04E53B|nr:DinB family protein [Cohnella xylanilytica]GIO14599.1 hypothetical protein J19TS2_41540 [Cohnella xylanilytica]